MATNAMVIRHPFSILLIGVVVGSAAALLYLLAKRFASDGIQRRMFGALVGAIVAFYTYGIVFELTFQALYPSYYLSGKVSLAIWVLLFAAVMISAWFIISNEVREFAVKGAVTALLVVASAEGLWRLAPVIGSPDSEKTKTAEPTQNSISTAETKSSLPNIYYILLDGYARPDQLRRRLDLDVSEFLNNLSDLGFVIPKASRSNYLTTNLSLGHTLLGDYFVIDQETHENFILGDGPSSAAEEGLSPIISRLKAKGCSFHRLGACNGIEDRCLSPYSSLPSDVVELLHNTPVIIALRYIKPTLVQINLHDASIPNVFAKLAESENQQVFAFAHVLYPHDTVYKEDCTRIENAVERSLGARTLGDRMLKDEDAYRSTVKCINRQLELGLNDLLAENRSKIVVLASDHGTAFAVPVDSAAVDWPADALIERSAIFNAWLLPQRCRNSLYDEITPINHFELILACLDDRPPEYKPDHTYAVYYGDKRVKRIPNSVFLNQ